MALPTLRISCTAARGLTPEIHTMLADPTLPVTVAAEATVNVTTKPAAAKANPVATSERIDDIFRRIVRRSWPP